MVNYHHKDRFGLRWKEIDERNVLNVATNRYVRATGSIGKRILRNSDRPLERGGVNRRFTRVSKEAFENFVSEKYINRSDVPHSISNFVDRIFQHRVADAYNEMFIVSFQNERGEYSGDRTVRLWEGDVNTKISSRAVIEARLNKLLLKGENLVGSDNLGESQLPMLDNFEYRYRVPIRGGASNTYSSLKHKLYNCRSPLSTNNNCLLMIIKQFLGLRERCDTMRMNLGLEIGEAIDILQIPILEKYYHINIAVHNGHSVICKTEENTYELEYGYFHKDRNSTYPKTLNVYLCNAHYYEVKKFNNINICQITGEELGKKKKFNKKEIRDILRKQNREYVCNKKKKEILLFFDFETVFDIRENSKLKPYSASWFTLGVDERYEFSEGLVEKTHFHCGFDCVEVLLKFILSCPSDSIYNLVGYNSSRFDNFFLLDAALMSGVRVDPFIVNSSVLKLNIRRHKSFDLCRFVMSSLDKACKDFMTSPAKLKGFSHFEVQDLYDSEGSDTFIKRMRGKEELVKYNKYDVLCLASLFQKVRDSVKMITGLEILASLTLASLAYKNLLGDEEFKKVEAPKTYEDDVFFRGAIIGGRTQTKYGKKFVEDAKDYRMYDVVSLYPYVMLERIYPTGSYSKTDKFMEGKMGIYSCEVVNRGDKPNVVPLRGETLDWDYKGVIRCALTSVDILDLKKYGHSVKIGEGIYWECTSDKVFEKLRGVKKAKMGQDVYKSEKDERYNPALRQMYKLVLNSVSGKMAERNHEDINMLVGTSDEVRKFEEKLRKDSGMEIGCMTGGKMFLRGKITGENAFKNPSPSFIGCFIYSYARSYMYNTMIYPRDTIYMDTDSGFIHKDEAPLDLVGTDFGCYDEEIYDETMCPTRAWFVAPKFYMIESDNEKKHKIRIKGINPSDVIIPNLDVEEYKKMGVKELYQKFHYGGLEKVYGSGTFEKIFKGEDVYVLCSQLGKQIFRNDLDARITQRFLIKHIHEGV